jgi:hypothetical protein
MMKIAGCCEVFKSNINYELQSSHNSSQFENAIVFVVFGSMQLAILTAVSVLISLLGCDKILSGRKVLQFRKLCCLHLQHQVRRF